MTAGGVEYTFYFAWVPEGTPWSLNLARFDENVFDLDIDHEEGQIPTAVVEVINPGEGLLNPGRERWAWISYSRDGCDPQGIFYGILLGIPEDTINNTIMMKFMARAEDFVYQKQQVARSLKVLPNYDPIFFTPENRDNPDSILEGWSALYHVDRVDLRVSVSDLLVGEDGTITFAAQDVFYDGFSYRLLQAPLTAINVKMDVEWSQQYRGSFFVGQWAWPTLGGDAFVGDWPRSGASLGSGWYAGVAWAGQRDPSIEAQILATRKPFQTSYSYNWVNTAKKHRTGDTMSVTINYTEPFGTQVVLKEKTEFGYIDPNAVDSFGDPDPINRPAKQSIDWLCYRTFALDFLGRQSVAVLSLVYMADRKRSERLEMTITADVQDVTTTPDITADTEQITLKSGDLSLPVVELTNWSSVGMGGAVTQGQVIFPDNPMIPGQTSSQIALNSGSTGDEQPTFSNIPGHTTQDNTVTWVSLGNTAPPEMSQDWLRDARVPLGTLLLPKPISGVPDFNSVQIPGTLNYPPTGTAVPIFSVFRSLNGGPGEVMHECTASGILGGLTAAQATFQTFINPPGNTLFIAIQAGTTGQFHPASFDTTPGSQTVDGGVIWQCIGPVELPIGGTPGMTPAATYFPTDRGRLSLQHGFCRARAKMRKRARAVEVGFDTRFEVAAQLSCRMNGIVSDPRLPGGQAFGKVIHYKLRVNGDSGVVKGSVVLGCAIGKRVIL